MTVLCHKSQHRIILLQSSCYTVRHKHLLMATQRHILFKFTSTFAFYNLHTPIQKYGVLPQRPFLSVGSKVGFTNDEQINGLGELMKAYMQQVKLVVNVDGVDDPPRGLSGRQPLLGGQIGVVHHGGNPTVRSVPPWPTHTLDQPLPVAPGPGLGSWSYWGLLLEFQRFPLPSSPSSSTFPAPVDHSPPWFPRVLLWGGHLCPLPEAKGSSFGSDKVRGFIILKLVGADVEVSHSFYRVQFLLAKQLHVLFPNQWYLCEVRPGRVAGVTWLQVTFSYVLERQTRSWL